jgi:L-lactate dehydrogenase complex protein LldE
MPAPIVDIFIPCFVDQLAPQTGMNMVKILQKLGCDVRFNPNQTCCGQPAYNAGFVKQACEVANKFLNDFSDESHYVVAPSASCIGMIRNSYTELFKNKPEFQQKLFSIQQRSFELSEFIVDILEVEKIEGAKFPYKVTYHDACSALRECGIADAPRKLLQNVAGLELIEMNACDTCCGFGGTFSVKYQGISTAMAEQKVQNAIDAQATFISSTDYSCLMHIDAFIKKQMYLLKTIHIADILAEGW